MKKLMLILLIAGNAYADKYEIIGERDPGNFIPDWGKQAERMAEIRKDNATADYLNRQPSQYAPPVYVAPAPGQFIMPSLNPMPVNPNVGVYGNQQRPW